MKIIELSRKTIISRIFPGDPAQVRAARRFVSEALGDGHPCRDDAVQLIGELIAESLRHAVSCRTSPEYAVAVQATADSARVTLTTQGCACWTSPDLTPGRGVHLVGLFTPYWGVSSDQKGVAVWFELGAGLPKARPAAAPRLRRGLANHATR
ncbi:MAG: hypothetical protein C0P63_002965 [Actinomycetales bacterium]|jgi:hypothetical protein|uniref:Anti-sigma regulatory factor, serine/threonine protein kinase n=1 Tax=Thermobispora bispora (strain ATCC 19993 / DSM 43833 / CBS 139.67 / JCM 10125 / KCTC 9307 / NBRC 14880 / R51) TaxID=469371 RepID=D6Y6K9_THEBD|nr:hypothetical protein [Thermobispora bispora]ADG87581.1 hypothetical protein Tbis_0857 [Thermobispora bispora DSM 43833]MDI9579141.1 hypothetical protein [Thermobispora sp.]QSI47505.1 hypothetical protein CYL17_06225 [Thermobispora bispora]